MISTNLSLAFNLSGLGLAFGSNHIYLDHMIAIITNCKKFEIKKNKKSTFN